MKWNFTPRDLGVKFISLKESKFILLGFPSISTVSHAGSEPAPQSHVKISSFLIFPQTFLIILNLTFGWASRPGYTTALTGVSFLLINYIGQPNSFWVWIAPKLRWKNYLRCHEIICLSLISAQLDWKAEVRKFYHGESLYWWDHGFDLG